MIIVIILYYTFFIAIENKFWLKVESFWTKAAIRKSKETNDYYKYGYVPKPGVGIVQVGIVANKVQSLSKSIET